MMRRPMEGRQLALGLLILAPAQSERVASQFTTCRKVRNELRPNSDENRGGEMNTHDHIPKRSFGPLLRECKRYGFAKTKAHELAKSGAIAVFKIGNRTFVYLDSLEALPERFSSVGGQQK